MYNYLFSLHIVQEFKSAHRRGWAFIENIYPSLNEDRATVIFMHNQKNWYVLKKCVKLADRLITSHLYSNDPDLLIRNIKFYKEYLLTKDLDSIMLEEQRKQGGIRSVFAKDTLPSGSETPGGGGGAMACS